MDFKKMVETANEVPTKTEQTAVVETEKVETTAAEKVEEAKVEEVKTETTEAKAEEKVEPEKKDEKVETTATAVVEDKKVEGNPLSFFDKKGEEKVEAKVEPSVREKELEAELGQYKSRIKLWEDSTVGQLAKLETGEIDLTKVDLKALAKEMAGEDFTKYPLLDLMKMDIQKQYSNLTEEEAIAAAEGEFAKLEDWQKKGMQPQLAAKLSASQKPSEILNRLQTVKDNQLAQAQTLTKEIIQQDVQNAVAEVAGSIRSLGEGAIAMDKEMNGVKITPEILTQMEQAFQKQVSTATPEDIFMGFFHQVTIAQQLESVRVSSYNEGLKEGLKQKTNANAHIGSPGVIATKENDTGVKEGMTTEQWKKIQ